MTDYTQRIEEAIRCCTVLAKRYEVEICRYDKTAIIIYCTGKHFDLVCNELKCSGIYREELRKGIITNFGYYK